MESFVDSEKAIDEPIQYSQPASPFEDQNVYIKKILPIGCLFALSLYLSNLVYLYISISTIQMLKSGSPIAVLLANFAFGLKDPNMRLVGVIFVISSGVAIACTSAIDYNMVGYGIQVAAMAVEATRTTLIQTLLHNVGLSPLASLHAFAPICFCCLLVVLIPVEGIPPLSAFANVGLTNFVLNAALTFMLNIASVNIIGLSSMVLSLSKVAKDILLISSSAVFLHDKIAPLQVLGYSIALLGLVLFKTFC